MSWTNFTDDHGRPWKVDQIGLWILVRQNLYNRAIQRHSQTVRETHLLLPDRVWVSTDFAAARAERDRESSPTYARLEQETIRDGARALQTLTEMRRQTEDAVDRVRTMQRNASHQTFENIERAVSRAETGREVAVFVRDLAGTTLVVGAGFMTGGAALGVLATGSGLRGVGRYEETGNIGSAVLTATGSFIVGAIPIGAGTGTTLRAGASMWARVGGEAIRTGERGAVIVVGALLDAQLEACGAIMEGRSGREVLLRAATRAGVDLLGGGMGAALDRWALPVVVRLATDTAASAGSDALVNVLSSRPAPSAPMSSESMPTPSAAMCDANSVLSSGNCSPQDWVRQIVMQEA